MQGKRRGSQLQELDDNAEELVHYRRLRIILTVPSCGTTRPANLSTGDGYHLWVMITTVTMEEELDESRHTVHHTNYLVNQS